MTRRKEGNIKEQKRNKDKNITFTVALVFMELFVMKKKYKTRKKQSE